MFQFRVDWGQSPSRIPLSIKISLEEEETLSAAKIYLSSTLIAFDSGSRQI